MMRVYAIILVARSLELHNTPEEHTVAAFDAAQEAQHAASVAKDVATHAVTMHAKAQEALTHAKGAVTDARLDTSGLSGGQKEALDKAKDALEDATKKLESEQLKQADWLKAVKGEEASQKMDAATVKSFEDQIADLEKKMAEAKSKELLEEYKAELESLKERLAKAKAIQAEDAGTGESIGKLRDELAKMEKQLETMEDIENLRAKIEGKKLEASAETAALRKELQEMEEMLKKLEDEGMGKAGSADTEAIDTEVKKLKESIANEIEEKEKAATAAPEPEPESSEFEEPASHNVDGMPYGDLEPFGREDTAQELTEASIRESDKMVDQLERAEVAEEKRAVFRSLTRLRGAAITSFDGVARSQTGNIDEYAHTHKWRQTHPLHHLAQDESDVSKWAFPNVD